MPLVAMVMAMVVMAPTPPSPPTVTPPTPAPMMSCRRFQVIHNDGEILKVVMTTD